MRTINLAIGLLALSSTCFVAQGADFLRGKESQDPLKWMPKAKAAAPFSKQNPNDMPLRIPEASVLPTADNVGYLDAPDGSVWYFTCNYDKDVTDQGDYYAADISGYHFIIYDENFKEIGKIVDTITLKDGETRVADVQLGPAVTQKFFNTDDKYEFMVSVVTNTDMYVNNIVTKVYQPDVAEPLMEMPGYYVSAVNAPLDEWSEDFYITFYTEAETETPEVNGVINTGDYVFDVYRKMKYGDEGPVQLHEFRVPMMLLSGDDAIPFLATARGNVPYFAVNHLKYCFWEEPLNYENENLTQDNEFIIETYKYEKVNYSDYEWSLVAKTVIPTEVGLTAAEPMKYYSLGIFRLGEDISFGVYNDNQEMPCYLVTEEVYQNASDDFLSDYKVYDHTGKHLLTLGENVEYALFQSDVAGHAPQVMFVFDGDTDNPRFQFVDYLTGKVEATLPYSIGNGMFMNTTADRVSDGKGGYLYVASQLYGDLDAEENTIQNIAYITPEGKLHHVDKLNLGKDIMYAQCYINGPALDPYIFNSDDETEYMVLVKRLIGSSASATQEELLIINPAGEELLHLTPSDDYGDINTISLLMDDNMDPVLSVVYMAIDEEYQRSYTIKSYNLPFEKFAKGTGTKADPYQISTIGEFRLIRRDMNAYYELTADLDASGVSFSSFDGEFKGYLDGKGHQIKNLEVKGSSIFGTVYTTSNDGKPTTTSGGEIKDLVFVNPKVSLEGNGCAGLLAKDAYGAKISNVQVYGAEISAPEADEYVGGLVGQFKVFSTMKECSFDGYVNAPKATVGGFAGTTNTGISIENCLFAGTVTGGDEVGGIAGNFQDAQAKISNCHVKADVKGKVNVGGVAGFTKRGLISNCVVEGTVEAQEPTTWTKSPNAGGIAGQVFVNWQNKEADNAIIKGCFVNLTSLKGFTPEDGAPNTVHRIAGYTSIDAGDEEQDGFVDLGLEDNYVISTLAATDAALATETGTEGKDVAASDLNKDFFSGIGFAFGGTSSAPWVMTASNIPSLYFEQLVLSVSEDKVTLTEGDEYVLYVNVLGTGVEDAVKEKLTVTSSDDKVIIPGTASIEGDVITVPVKAGEAGEATLTVTLGELSTETKFTVEKAVVISMSPASLSVGVGETAKVAVHFDGVGVVSTGLLYAMDAYLTKDGIATIESPEMEGEYIYIGITGLAPGNVRLNVEVNGFEGSCNITVTDGSGVENIVAEQALKLAGDYVVAEGEDISIFNAAGVLVAKAHGKVYVKDLAEGVYVARTPTGCIKFQK